MTNIEKLEQHLRRARKARATRDQYLGWARRYGQFCRGRRFETPQVAVCEFLSSLADHSAATQNGALNALAGRNGLYAALGVKLGKLPGWVKARKPVTVPVWVTQAETEAITSHLAECWALMVQLMFGGGLRVGEVVSLRWRDLDFERGTVTVKQGKGFKDRVTFLPRCLAGDLRERSKRCRGLWEEDRGSSRPGVMVPRAIANKRPRAGEDWAFFWVFPAAGESRDPETGRVRRHHVHRKSLGKALRVAVRRAGIAKRVTCHGFRHGFATAYLEAGGALHDLQGLMGHKSIETTEVYLHCLPNLTDRVGSPLDQRRSVVAFPQARPAAEGSRTVLAG